MTEDLQNELALLQEDLAVFLEKQGEPVYAEWVRQGRVADVLSDCLLKLQGRQRLANLLRDVDLAAVVQRHA